MSTLKSSAENLTLNADGSNNDVIIQSNGSTIVTVDGSAAAVGVGIVAPLASLHIYHATTNNVLRLESGDASAGLEFKDNSTSNLPSIYNATDDLIFSTGGAERLRIPAAGGLTFNGDTAAANALDDYEEGTWTPGFNGGAAPEASAASATYVKVGTMVTCYLMWWGFTGSAVAAQITGCPFTSKAGTYVTGTLGANTWTTNGAGCWGYTAATIRIQDCVNLNEATGIVGYPKYISMAITYQTT